MERTLQAKRRGTANTRAVAISQRPQTCGKRAGQKGQQEQARKSSMPSEEQQLQEAREGRAYSVGSRMQWEGGAGILVRRQLS